jgi:hypothetical protein
MEEIEKGSRQTVGEQSLGKDITRKWRGKVRRERIATYDNKARTKETGDAKHWRRDPKGGGREDKEPYAKPKGRCGLGVLREREDPDPGKTPRIRRCRRAGR